jgi:hypothetical protein
MIRPLASSLRRQVSRSKATKQDDDLAGVAAEKGGPHSGVLWEHLPMVAVGLQQPWLQGRAGEPRYKLVLVSYIFQRAVLITGVMMSQDVSDNRLMITCR